MTSLSTDHAILELPNPIDLAEEMAGANNWDFSREEDELIILLSGEYCDMHLRLFWHQEYKTLQLVSFLDLKIPENRLSDMQNVIHRINETMFLGHFEYWHNESAILFRHASLASDPMAGSITADHLANLIEIAVKESNKVYPVFQFIMWGGLSPEEAIEASMLECAGSC
ncbi:YbjN domain-containing protein [Temperatibacter marinus]|uniref:YbjN domain-containing protein n=1 Tax=Temperatibacter marinus TaxID=1456591 RepID=A0AA52H9G8_9PROT|nr:YbjN domain-containing protein [Temperatibacter marinus]WND01670.1 YbjN domain-containing protein [Temperatibacter marinus]